MTKLHIDIETYCDLKIADVGAYKYISDPSFEILLIAYAFDNDPVKIFDIQEIISNDLTEWDRAVMSLLNSTFSDERIKLCAHNTNFERNAFNRIGLKTKINRWSCSMVKAAYCGLPLGLDEVSKALQLEEKGKLATGNALIKYFCQPCKPTKANGGRTRNLPEHDPEKWEEFKRYCINDVEAERETDRVLDCYTIPTFEQNNYIIDQKINDRGVLVDLDFVKKAVETDNIRSEYLLNQMQTLTGLDNPNSLPQLKEWLLLQTGEEIKSVTKETIDPLIEEFVGGPVEEALQLRKKLSKTSVKKYKKIVDFAGSDNRARGLFQFYGANRTGRWAGRGPQGQNLPQNHLKDLDSDRECIKNSDYEVIDLIYENISDTLSQLIRTSFVAGEGKKLIVADYASIEARVIAWIAGEQWRLDVFNSHGKIYEASASMMFNIPIEEITKGSDLRQKGKVAELALGYQGASGAMARMGAEEMGLSDPEIAQIVKKWRAKSPNIVKLWGFMEQWAKRALSNPDEQYYYNINDTHGLIFHYDRQALTIELPSGRKLFYWDPQMQVVTKWGKPTTAIKYRGMDQETKQWGWVETYGGKLVENIVQAVARDLLANAMYLATKDGFNIVMHVHDEIVAEESENRLQKLCDLMCINPTWAEGLPLAAEGFITNYYKKD